MRKQNCNILKSPLLRSGSVRGVRALVEMEGFANLSPNKELYNPLLAAKHHTKEVGD
jgi:hypothetical protein